MNALIAPSSAGAATRGGPVAYVPFPRAPIDGACAVPEERL
jgi:hypothetical protein